jgi:hypothetical protein
MSNLFLFFLLLRSNAGTTGYCVEYKVKTITQEKITKPLTSLITSAKPEMFSTYVIILYAETVKDKIYSCT